MPNPFAKKFFFRHECELAIVRDKTCRQLPFQTIKGWTPVNGLVCKGPLPGIGGKPMVMQ
jgi:hypothetical protein